LPQMMMLSSQKPHAPFRGLCLQLQSDSILGPSPVEHGVGYLLETLQGKRPMISEDNLISQQVLMHNRRILELASWVPFIFLS
jgi:hypothetical protein